MRIASKTVYDNIRLNLSKAVESMFKANNVVSSGKKINKLSDDPVGLVTVLGLRCALDEVDQLGKNVATGKSWLSTSESALSQIHDLLVDIKAVCVEMASATKGSAERANAAGVVDGLLEQIVALANSAVGGRYIFAGTQTDIPPFTYDGTGSSRAVSYNGNEDPFSIIIGKGLLVPIGRDGETIFGDDNFDWGDPDAGKSNLFKTLIDLGSYLRDNDIEGIQESLGYLDSHLETVNMMISDTGTKIFRLEAKENILSDLRLNLTEKMSLLEDADIAEAIMNLKAMETAYQAALASSAEVMKMTLVDFL